MNNSTIVNIVVVPDTWSFLKRLYGFLHHFRFDNSLKVFIIHKDL